MYDGQQRFLAFKSFVFDLLIIFCLKGKGSSDRKKKHLK